MKPSHQDENEPETTTVSCRFLDGDDDAFAVLWNRVRAGATKEANRRLRRAGISPRLFDDDDATSCVLYRIHLAQKRGKLAWVKSDDDFRRLFSAALRRVVLDASRRFNASKRGGTGPTAHGRKDRQDAATTKRGGKARAFPDRCRARPTPFRAAVRGGLGRCKLRAPGTSRPARVSGPPACPLDEPPRLLHRRDRRSAPTHSENDRGQASRHPPDLLAPRAEPMILRHRPAPQSQDPVAWRLGDVTDPHASI